MSPSDLSFRSLSIILKPAFYRQNVVNLIVVYTFLRLPAVQTDLPAVQTDLEYRIGVSEVNQPGAPFADTLIKEAIASAKAQALSLFPTSDLTARQYSHDPCESTKIYYDFHVAVDDAVKFLNMGVSAVIGSPCTQEFLVQAALCAYRNSDPAQGEVIEPTPIFTGGAPLALHIDQFDNAYRLSYSTATQWDMFFRLCKEYGWVHISPIYDSDDPEIASINSDLATLGRSRHNLTVNAVGFNNDSDWNTILSGAQNKSRVLVLLASGRKIRQIMLAASAVGMCNGSFAFFAFDPSGLDFVKNKEGYLLGDDNGAKVVAALSALQVFMLSRLNQTIPRFGSLSDPNYYQISHYNAFMVAAYILAQSLILPKSAIPAGQSFKSYYVYHKNLDFSSLNIHPQLYMNANGDFSEPMDMYGLNIATKSFEQIVGYRWIRLANGSISQPLTYSQLPRWGPTTTVPADKPPCGFIGEDCPVVEANVALAAGIGVSASTGVIILILVSIYLWRQRRKGKDAKESLIVHWDDIVVPVTPDATAQKIREEAMHVDDEDKVESFAIKSIAAEDDTVHEKILPYGVYWNEKLYMARLSSKYRLPMSTKVMDEINRASQLKHENVAKFVAVCLDADHVFVLYEYCTKGTLQELLLDIHHKLDWTIRFSLLNDIVKGLAYIHPSPILLCHGRLTSACCFIDSRFVLKLTDYGLNSFFELDVAEQWATKRDVNYFTNMLWTAPEHMRQDLTYGAEPVKPPAKSGDIYSFGIVLQETILRIPPFGMYGAMSSEDIVDAIRKPNTGKDELNPPFRPIIPDESANPGLIEMAKRCWAQNPGERPSIKQIKVMMKLLGKSSGFGEKRTILDTLLDQMDDLMTNLQNIIEERGHILLDEKTRSDALLFRLLPREVAERMKKGEHIQPESFDSCTVMVFCIENFDKITADCTVLQMTEFVLDFHKYLEECIARYDCIKIDFHDSMGTLASGLPVRNDKRHAAEIAKAALHLQSTVKQFEPGHMHMVNETRVHCKLAIGINSGTCVAGVIGDVLPRYCLFGEAVLIALRMLEIADERNAQCSSATKELLDSDFELVEHVEIFVKGKGIIMCYSLRGVIGDQELEILQQRYQADGGKMRHRQASYI